MKCGWIGFDQYKCPICICIELEAEAEAIQNCWTLNDVILPHLFRSYMLVFVHRQTYTYPSLSAFSRFICYMTNNNIEQSVFCVFFFSFFIHFVCNSHFSSIPNTNFLSISTITVLFSLVLFPFGFHSVRLSIFHVFFFSSVIVSNRFVCNVTTTWICSYCHRSLKWANEFKSYYHFMEPIIVIRCEYARWNCVWPEASCLSSKLECVRSSKFELRWTMWWMWFIFSNDEKKEKRKPNLEH